MMHNNRPGSSHEAGDLRVQRTRKVLREVVILLSKEKGFEQVTVSEIAEQAMVNRATFYRHYQDKYDLVETCVREVLETLPLPQIEGQHVPLRVTSAIITTFFASISEHAAFFQALSGKRGWPRLMDCIGVSFERLIQQYFQGWLQTAEQAAIPLDLCMTLVDSAGRATLKWWLEHDLIYSPEQMSTWFLQLVRPSLCQLLSVQADENDSDNSKMSPH